MPNFMWIDPKLWGISKCRDIHSHTDPYALITKIPVFCLTWNCDKLISLVVLFQYTYQFSVSHGFNRFKVAETEESLLVQTLFLTTAVATAFWPSSFKLLQQLKQPPKINAQQLLAIPLPLPKAVSLPQHHPQLGLPSLKSRVTQPNQAVLLVKRFQSLWQVFQDYQ